MSDNLFVTMNTLRSSSRRLPAIVVCLALFLLGSNYCVLAAWSGHVRMDCMSVAAAVKAKPTCPRCASHAGKHAEAKPSCCPAPVVQPSAPSIEKAAILYMGPVLAAAIDADATPPLTAHRGDIAACESPPPTRLARAPLPARAPPLA
jgi:hypothetical protein